MDFDDVVIGSGMSSLGAVLGLDAGRKVLILGGLRQGQYTYYNERRTVPSSFSGLGGLGNDWHGVIPTGLHNNFGGTDHSDFAATFARFYPCTEIRSRLTSSCLFVPWRPIRPAQELAKLVESRQGRLVLIQQAAVKFRVARSGIEVSTADSVYRAKRIWVAAGALHTPALLENSLGTKLARGFVSDHALCYVGQIENIAPPVIQRSRDGMFVQAEYGPGDCGLYTRRPARFSFKKLDYGIEQRAVFGLPTGNAIKKIIRRMSPGLLSEAFFNRFGVFSKADLYTVYSQVPVKDAYVLSGSALEVQPAAIQSATRVARENHPYPGLIPSRRPEMYIEGIHLHHSVDLDSLAKAGVNTPEGPVQVVDASILPDIGPDHHTFKLLLAAMKRARQS